MISAEFTESGVVKGALRPRSDARILLSLRPISDTLSIGWGTHPLFHQLVPAGELLLFPTQACEWTSLSNKKSRSGGAISAASPANTDLKLRIVRVIVIVTGAVGLARDSHPSSASTLESSVSADVICHAKDFDRHPSDFLITRIS